MAVRRLRGRLVKAGAAVLACSMLLTACSGNSGREDRDDDEEETEVTETETETEAETEVTVTETEVPETTVPAVAIELVNLEYLTILSEYEDEIRIVETQQYSAIPCCDYVDITGDDVPELIIQYNSDPENGYNTGADYFTTGAMRFFTYDAASMEAVEMLKVDQTILNAGGGFNTDVVMLDNGNIIVTTGWGDEDSELWITEYTVAGNELVKANELYSGAFLQENGDDYYYEYDYTYNGVEISEEEYNSIREGYVNSFTGVITRSPFYDSDWYEPDSWVTKILSLPDYAMNYDDIVAMLGG